MAGDECDVCGETAIGVASSRCGPMSFAYCKRCAEEGLEPWVAIVGLGFSVSWSEMADHAKKMVEKSCEFHGKTMEDYHAEVKRAERDYDDYCKQRQEAGGDSAAEKLPVGGGEDR